MDYRSIEWLQLLPQETQFVVHGAPPAFHELIGPRIDPVGRGLIAWGARRTDLRDLESYESVVLVNPDDIPVSALRSHGFLETVSYVALPSLDAPHWLVPVENAAMSRASLGLVTPWRYRDQMKKQVLSLLAGVGQLRRVGDTVMLARRTPSELERRLAAQFRLPRVVLAMKTGGLGVLRKTTLQVMTEHGVTVGFAKLASSAEARAVVEREIARLRELSRYPELRSVVPSLIEVFEVGDGLVSVLALGPDRRGPRAFGEVHRDFLNAMASATGRTMLFGESEMWKDMLAKSETLMPRLSTAWRERLSTSMTQVAESLGPRQLLLAMAHRDFGPWNTRLTVDGRLWVFDWDNARKEMIPLYDLFSFHIRDQGAFVRREDPVNMARRIFAACRRWAPHIEDALIPDLFRPFLVERALSQLMGATRNDAHYDHEWLTVTKELLDRESEWVLPFGHHGAQVNSRLAAQQ